MLWCVPKPGMMFGFEVQFSFEELFSGDDRQMELAVFILFA